MPPPETTPVALLPIDEARRRVLGAVAPLPAETVALPDGLGRVLAQDVEAIGDVPPFPCSAMDGYAIRAGDAGRRLRLVGESRAGAPAQRPLGEAEAIRVSTGAAIPSGATAVIPQEQTEVDGDSVRLQAAVPAGEHVRDAGEDMRAGTIVLAAGTPVGPIELGAAVAAGAGALTVARRPRVGVLCTGDELRAPGESLGPGEIHNSNGPMLTGLARRCGAAAAAAARNLPDDRGATVDGIGAALRDSDVVVISGGVSVGPHDHVKPALAQLGVREVFWSVALQPGKPTWFGVADDGTLVFGLPGNPVSAVVTFSLFVAPALAALQCAPAPRPMHRRAGLGVAVRRNPRREQAVRVSLRANDANDANDAGDHGGAGGHGDHGDHVGADDAGAAHWLVAHPTGAQGSHILTSLLAADALAMIPAGDGELPAGAVVALEALVH